jgi:hypothetical protein
MARPGSLALEPRPFGLLDHLLYGLGWLGFLAVVLVAGALKPDPSGLGTHTELHLPPCGFYLVFHKPCPSCGMTTAFALVMHGKPLQAFHTQPAGVAVFAAGLALWLYIPLAWFRRRPIQHLLESKIVPVAVWALVAIILGVWFWRLATG